MKSDLGISKERIASHSIKDNLLENEFENKLIYNQDEDYLEIIFQNKDNQEAKIVEILIRDYIWTFFNKSILEILLVLSKTTKYFSNLFTQNSSSII